MQELTYAPDAFWKLDDSVPFIDYTGNASIFTISQASSKGLALNKNVSASHKFSSLSKGSISCRAYERGGDFSMTLSLYVVNSGVSNQQVCSSGAIYDGVSVKGTVVSFGTAYAATGEALASYDVGSYRKIDIAGVHTREKNSLYIDGLMVAEVDITPAQQLDSYVTASNTFYAGGSAGAQEILMNSLAIYSKALNSQQVNAIYYGNNAVLDNDPSLTLAGNSITLSTDINPPVVFKQYNTAEQWSGGFSENASFNDLNLVPDKIADFTTAGFWESYVELAPNDEASTTSSVYMNWDGENVTVQISLQEGVYVNVSKNTSISNLVGTTETGFIVRVQFTSGVSAAFINNLRIFVFNKTTVSQPDGDVVVYAAPFVISEEFAPRLLREDWGVRLFGNSVSVTSAVLNIKTVELWIRQQGVFTVSTNLTSTTTYGTAVLGEWKVLHYTSATNIAGPFVISGNVQVGKVVVYESQLTAPQISNLIPSYTGYSNNKVFETAPVSIVEEANNVKIYSHDWEIVTS
jgi:hypothetical protein